VKRFARNLLLVLLFAPGAVTLPAAPADTVVYEIFVRSFADAASGPLAGDGIGDLQGLIERLDHLNDGDPATTTDLGVSTIWLLPVHPSPSYHGYDVTDYFSVNPQYGDLPLFRRFLAEARRRGIRVIIDLVLNHASSEHPFFLAATRPDAPPAQRDHFLIAPEPRQSAGPWGDRCWHPLAAGGGYYYGVFDRGMPDWNFQNPAVTDHHRRVADFWLREVGVDGFRLDAVRYLFEEGDSLQDLPATKAWLHAFAAHCRRLKPGVLLVGEAWADTGQAASYVLEGGLDATFEFDLAQAFLETAGFATPSLVTARLQRALSAYDGARFASFLANHDQERTRTRLGGDFNKTRVAALLQFTAPGLPFIYYGEEIGLTGRKPDPDLRTPMPWNRRPHGGFTTGTPWRDLQPGFAEVNVAAQTTAPDSLLSLYRQLIRLRAQSDALRTGTPVAGFSFAGPGLVADIRASPTDVVLVLVNVTDRPCEARLTLPDAVAVLGAPDLFFTSALDLLATDFGAKFTLQSRSAAVFRWPRPSPPALPSPP
jgi:glycosidase